MTTPSFVGFIADIRIRKTHNQTTVVNATLGLKDGTRASLIAYDSVAERLSTLPPGTQIVVSVDEWEKSLNRPVWNVLQFGVVSFPPDDQTSVYVYPAGDTSDYLDLHNLPNIENPSHLPNFTECSEHDVFYSVWTRTRVIQAFAAAVLAGWDGDGEVHYFLTPSFTVNDTLPMIRFRQSNNGTTFFVSPVPVPGVPTAPRPERISHYASQKASDLLATLMGDDFKRKYAEKRIDIVGRLMGSVR